MPLDGNGSYTLPSPEFPAVPNTLIQSAMFNAILLDIAGALSLAFYRDGQAPMTADLDLGSRRILNVSEIRSEVLALGTDVRVPDLPPTDTSNRAASTSFVKSVTQGMAGAVKWEEGETYPEGIVVWSPLSSLLYRKLSSGVSLVDPSLDPLDWALIPMLGVYQVGDYLDTARVMPDNWLRRDGSGHLMTAYPELAPMMVSIPAAFDFVTKVADAGGTETVTGQMTSFDGKLVVWPTQGTHIQVSEDGGITWQGVEVFSTSTYFGSGAVFQDKLFIGADAGKYLESTDGLTFTLKTMSGVTTACVNFVASPTALLAFGQRVFSPIDQGFLRRSTDGINWSNISVSGLANLSLGYGGTYQSGIFYMATGLTSALYSKNDGVSFTIASATIDANLELGELQTIQEIDGVLYGLGRIRDNGEDFPALAVIDPLTMTLSDVKLLPSELYSVWTSRLRSLVNLNGKFVAATGANSIAYSFDLEDWIVVDLPSGQAGAELLVEGNTLCIRGATTGITQGEFFESEFFRTPSDNPQTGWIKAANGDAGSAAYSGISEAPDDGELYGRRNKTWVPGLVDVDSPQLLENKVLGSGSRNEVVVGSAVNLSDASVPCQQVTLTGNVTASVDLSVGVRRELWLNPGAFTVTWPAGIVWKAGTAPTLPASKWSRLVFEGRPGSTTGVGELYITEP